MIRPDQIRDHVADHPGPPSWRPAWAEIDLAAVSVNVDRLKQQAAAGLLMAVVKADGYGHGLVPSAHAALAGGADWLAVALVEEGETLRQAGITAPVLVLTEPPPAAVPAMLEVGLTPAVYSLRFIEALEEEGDRRSRSVSIHLKLDTGMHRAGVPLSDRRALFGRLRDSRRLVVEAIWSHLAVADEPGNPFTAHQVELFQAALKDAADFGLRPEIVHLCNSAGTLALHEHHYDMVRPGLAIYGLAPHPELAERIDLRPALTLRSRISFVKEIEAGDAVGYGLRWRAREKTKLATVPMGYADGLTRALSNRGEVLIKGCRLPIAGTISMDQFCVDAKGLDLAPSDEVVLIGSQGPERISANEWAQLLGTISYEVITRIGKRIPRVYIGDPNRSEPTAVQEGHGL